MEDYIAQYNDTLETIADKKLGNKSRWYEIAQLNNLQSPYQLFIGQVIKLPNKQSAFILTAPPLLSPLTPATMAFARGFLFVVFEQLPEVGSDKVIRKIAMIPESFTRHPDLSPTNPLAGISGARHALGEKPSQFLSSSNRPIDSPTNVNQYIPDALKNKNNLSINPRDFIGRDRPVLVDLNKLPQGTRILTESELILELNPLKDGNPRVNTLIRAIQNVEGETLIEGGIPKDAVKKVSNVHSAYILTAEELQAKRVLGQITEEQLTKELNLLTKSYKRVKIVGRVGRVISVVGIIFTVADVAVAAQKSYDKQSYKPLAAETVRQIGGWGGAIAGAKIGFLVGAALGIETGPGLFVTGAIGSIIFGAAGYFGANWVASWIDDDSIAELRKDVNRVEDMRTREITIDVGKDDTQYDFCRNALIAAAIEAQRESFRMVDNRLPWRFADKFYPIRSSNIKKDFTMNWVPPTGKTYSGKDKDKDGVIDPTEWKGEQGKKFTYQLNEREVDELIKMLFNLSR